MTKKEIKQIILLFQNFYPNVFKDRSVEEIELMAELWLKKFSKYSYKEMMFTVDRLTTKSKWMPSVSEIIEELEKLRTPELQMNANEEWEIVIEAVRTHGYYSPSKAFQTFSDRTSYIVKHIGWNRICQSNYDEMVWIKKEFVELFDSKLQLDYEVLAMNEKCLTVNELKRLAEIKSKENLMLKESDEKNEQ